MSDVNLETRIAELEAVNSKQNKKIYRQLKQNKKVIDSTKIFVAGGIASIVLLLVSVGIKNESQRRSFDRVTDHIFEFIALAVTGGTGYMASRKEHEDKDEDDLDDE